MSTIVDISKDCNVAISTVSNVLTQKKYVSKEISQRVLDSCKKLNYKVNVMASALVTKKTNLIGVFLTAAENRFDVFYADLLHGVCVAGIENDIRPILYFNVLGETDIKRIFYSGNGFMDGAIILSPLEDDFRLKEMAIDNIHHVVIGNPYSSKSNSIDTDNEKITYDLTAHLVGNGHKNIVFINGPSELTICKDREKGFRRAVRDSGLRQEDQLIFNIKESKDDAEKLFLRNALSKYTAFILDSSDLVDAVEQFCATSGKTVGRDVAVVSLGSDKYTRPDITSVIVDYYQVGYDATNLLVKVIGGSVKGQNKLSSKYSIHFAPSSQFVIKH